MAEQLNTKGKIAYASGMLGYSILINIISVMLVYFYIPPNNVGLTALVPQITYFGVISLLALVVASGRLLDAITDPVIAYLSDRSDNSSGRRIPFLKWSILPSAVFCVLIFIPLTQNESTTNLWWLAFTQAGFYFALTVYIVPYNALLPELAPDSKEKVALSALLSVSFVLGIIFSSQTPWLADLFEQVFNFRQRSVALQWAIGSFSLLAFVFMLIPIWYIDENKYCVSKPITISISTAFRQTISNRNFVVFVMAETLYFISLTLVVSGLLYYLTVLLELEESLGGFVMATMVLVSLCFYPLVVKWSNQNRKKELVFGALLLLSVLIGAVYFMGKVPLPPKVQIFGFAVLAALPVAVLGILPFTIISEEADKDGTATGQQKEAMYFAIRNLANKFGQTFGIMLFAMLTLWGKDPGNDLGIRLSGVLGFVLCAAGALLFTRYQPRRTTE
ncbi:MAG: MFS transporter [Bacteroidota bacterium]